MLPETENAILEVETRIRLHALDQWEMKRGMLQVQLGCPYSFAEKREYLFPMIELEMGGSK